MYSWGVPEVLPCEYVLWPFPYLNSSSWSNALGSSKLPCRNTLACRFMPCKMANFQAWRGDSSPYPLTLRPLSIAHWNWSRRYLSCVWMALLHLSQCLNEHLISDLSNFNYQNWIFLFELTNSCFTSPLICGLIFGMNSICLNQDLILWVV